MDEKIIIKELMENGFHLNENDLCFEEDLNSLDDSCFTETDIWQLSDDRVLKSNVYDIYGGDNFADYCKYFFDMLDEEEYFQD